MTSRARTIEKMFVMALLVFVFQPAMQQAKADQTVSAEAKAEAKTEAKSMKMKQRLEQLFVWRVSDKLSFTPKEENQFVEQYKKLSDEKLKLVNHAEETLAQIEKNKSDVKKSQLLVKEYLGIQAQINQLSSKEIQNIEKLFGSSRAAEYVLLKREMTQKFKDALTSTDRSSASASN